MRRFALYAAIAAALTLALAPAIAEARAGRGGSMGSRGAQTYTPPPPTRVAPQPAQPVQRSTQPAPAPTQTQRPATAPGPTQPGMAQAARPGFGVALMGGLLAGGLLGLMMGSGFFGAGLGGFLGVLLQLLLIGGLVWLAFRLFSALRGGAPATATAASGSATPPFARSALPDLGGSHARTGAADGMMREPIVVTEADLSAFERALHEVQVAWSEADRDRLARLVTPEMLGYLSEQLDEDARRGVRNRVRDLIFEEGDVAEAWREGAREYVTVAMRYSMVDEDVPTGAPVSVPASAPRTTATEYWTFVRVQGGPWLLSAIQQAG